MKQGDADLRRREIHHLALWVIRQPQSEQMRWANNQGKALLDEVRTEIRAIKAKGRR